MPTDYEKDWPQYLPDWCRDKINKHKQRLADKNDPPSHVEGEQLKSDIRILERIINDWEGRK